MAEARAQLRAGQNFLKAQRAEEVFGGGESLGPVAAGAAGDQIGSAVGAAAHHGDYVVEGPIAGKERLAALAAMSPEERDFLPGEYLGIRRSLTVHGSGRVNFHTASLDVLAAMGVPASEALAIVESRRTDSPVVHSPPADRSRWLTTPPRIFLIQSLGSLTGTHAEYRITAILQNVGTRIQPHLQVIAWTEG